MPASSSPRLLWPEAVGVVFDLDGTLIDSEKAICAAASLAFADVGLAVDEAAVADHLGAPLVELFDEFDRPSAARREVLLGERDLDVVEAREHRRLHFISRYIAHYDLHPDKDPPALPGVVEALDQLRAMGIPLGVATTKPTRMAVSHLTTIGLLDRFASVCGTDPPLLPKPAPDVVLAACRGIGLSPSAVIMVGDTSRDVGAARAAGCRAVVVAYGIHRLNVASSLGADVVVSDLRQLIVG